MKSKTLRSVLMLALLVAALVPLVQAAPADFVRMWGWDVDTGGGTGDYGEGGWRPTTRKKGPSRRLPKQRRRNNKRLLKL